jgi:hypothetical protein
VEELVAAAVAPAWSRARPWFPGLRTLETFTADAVAPIRGRVYLLPARPTIHALTASADVCFVGRRRAH